MNQFRVADRARADLDDIWIYIAQDNPEAADKYLRTIEMNADQTTNLFVLPRPDKKTTTQ